MLEKLANLLLLVIPVGYFDVDVELTNEESLSFLMEDFLFLTLGCIYLIIYDTLLSLRMELCGIDLRLLLFFFVSPFKDSL